MKEDMKIMADNFKSFTKVLIMVKNAALHSKDIFKDAAAAVTDFNRDKRQFGYDIGDIIRIVLMQNRAVGNPVNDAAAAVRGIVDGAFGTHIPDLANCVGHAQDIIADISMIVEDCKKGDPLSIIHAVTLIGELLSIIPDAVQTCPQVPDSSKAEFQYLKEKFSKPLDALMIASRVFSNHATEIVYEIIDIPVAFKDEHDFYRGGKDIGDIVGFIILEAHNDTDLFLM